MTDVDILTYRLSHTQAIQIYKQHQRTQDGLKSPFKAKLLILR